MKTILVDDCIYDIENFESECANMPNIQLIGTFTSAMEALEFSKKNMVDVALLDVNITGISVTLLFDKLKYINPKMIIYFVTAHQSSSVDGIIRRLDNIIFKPYDKKDICEALSRSMALNTRGKTRLYCRTFGKFDVFCDEVPVRFRSAKAKEIFAFCVYRRGAPVSAEEIIDKLWINYTGTVGNCSIFRATIKSLVDQLKELGCEEAFQRERGYCYILENHISSDYYNFLNGDPYAICEYQGDFMTDYLWGNGEAYSLDEKKLLYKPDSLKNE